ncbi:PREDICTED: F-box/LRR-repeat protein At3g58980-like [Camelina sativa]|uniref:F-box/LRR-repeat protein At3g58980-like n=1 Tax=Camelina sativa TaxID=90675 RepID=A0ABM1RRP3_CAMSA|nr:PREDICTED: F-box/LRR-repeat protein At3g58980-like [Camelina sativa]XP_019101674.1 PREDICTED: F-box/LRR-repeat protein At3g58980-like [Camelina sativa]XP_019101675.1 PREDICTED: F-box/LRR-repeat protein At3g58980-like [Camelina sativa]XP_019101676.1 PREDICTED: F-box/LRR-repeat protein At3g58980-like [Camelina sativa]XP_019101677.1 PREDICTED: F-box/LRR-repeat protein At3g58980-like [Camelina sativa]XP_019101678.1 PREDICTED: F-box/LRR-repeat protein At3g58980-like [Camelina sativa]XP_01910167
MDRISGLPDELIMLIVSYLAAKDAASLITSRRFRNLYTIIPDLEFDDTAQFQGSFTDLVSLTMAARLKTTTRIRRFSLKSKRGLDQDRINHWLRDVLNHRGVMDIEMGIYGDNGYTLPLEIFTCKTLKNLKLGREIEISLVPENALLPSLETLVFDDCVRFCNPVDCAFNAFLSACPVLKELTIDGMCWETWEWSGFVSSRSLERLTIGRELVDFDGPNPQYITFDTPSLAYLEYGDFVPDGYTIVNFESLVEAKLNLLVMVNRRWHGQFANYGDVLSSNVTNLIQGIRNVQILELSSPYTFETLYFFRDAIPVLEKLHHLTMVNDDMGFCWRFLPFLLNKAPNLKTLVIEGGFHCLEPDDTEEPDFDEEADNVEEPDYVCACLSGYSCLLTCPVEVLEITLWYGGTTGELQQVKHFLGKLPRLELLKVRTWRRISDSDKLRIHTDLHMFPRASSNCRVQLSFT